MGAVAYERGRLRGVSAMVMLRGRRTRREATHGFVCMTTGPSRQRERRLEHDLKLETDLVGAEADLLGPRVEVVELELERVAGEVIVKHAAEVVLVLEAGLGDVPAGEHLTPAGAELERG